MSPPPPPPAVPFAPSPAITASEFTWDRQRVAVDRLGAVSVASVSFPSLLVAAVPVDHGWVFVDYDGNVARSDTFLGTPQPLGRFRCQLRAEPSSRGRVALVDPEGTLWTTDGRAAATPTPLDGPVRAAAFGDRRVGVAVLMDGQIRVTRDGGRSWSPRDLHGELAWSVRFGPGGLIVASTGGRFAVDAAGVLAPLHTVPASPDRAAALRSPEVARRFDAAMRRPRSTFVAPSAGLGGGGVFPDVYTVHAFQLSVPGETYLCRPGSGDPRPFAELESARLDATERPGPLGLSFQACATPRGTLRLPVLSRVGVEWVSTPLVWVDPRGDVRSIPDAFAEAYAGGFEGDMLEWSTLAQADGGVVVSIALRAETQTAVVALDVGPEGKVRGRRPSLSSAMAPIGFARRGRCVGPVLADQRSPGAMQWVPIVDAARGCPPQPDTELPAFAGAVPACGARDENSLDLMIGAQSPVDVSVAADLPPYSASAWPIELTRIEHSARGYCLRAYERDWPSEGNAPVARMRLNPSPDGALTGVYESGPTAQSLECRLQSP